MSFSIIAAKVFHWMHQVQQHLQENWSRKKKQPIWPKYVVQFSLELGFVMKTPVLWPFCPLYPLMMTMPMEHDWLNVHFASIAMPCSSPWPLFGKPFASFNHLLIFEIKMRKKCFIRWDKSLTDIIIVFIMRSLNLMSTYKYKNM